MPARAARASALALALVVAAPSARAERHGCVGIGPALLLSGDRGEPTRWTIVAELLGQRRYGGGLALHAIGGPDRRGVAAARLSVQLAAAPPKLWLRLHGEGGLALDDRAPMMGVGFTITLRLWRAAALVVEPDAQLFVDGVAGTRLTISAAALAAIAW